MARPVKPLEQGKTFNKMLYKSEIAVANQSGAMEADTISKIGASSKSLMNRGNFFSFFVIAALAVSVAFMSCGGGSGKSISGTYVCSLGTETASIIFSGD